MTFTRTFQEQKTPGKPAQEQMYAYIRRGSVGKIRCFTRASQRLVCADMNESLSRLRSREMFMPPKRIQRESQNVFFGLGAAGVSRWLRYLDTCRLFFDDVSEPQHCETSRRAQQQRSVCGENEQDTSRF